VSGLQIEQKVFDALSSMIKNGELHQAKQQIDLMLKSHLDMSQIIKLEDEKWRIQLIIAQYTLTYNALYSALTNAIKDFNEDDMHYVTSQGYLIYHMIEGEKMYHQRAVKTVCRVFIQRVVNNAFINRSQFLASNLAMQHHIQNLIQKWLKSMTIMLKVSLEMIDKDEQEKRPLKVYLPIPRATSLTLLDYTPIMPEIASFDASQRTVYFSTSKKCATYSVTYAYTMMASYQKRQLKSGLALSKEDKEKYCHFLIERPPHITFSEEIQQLAQTITAEWDAPLEKARAIYDWVTQHINYTFMPDYRVIESLCMHALNNRSGDCGTQAVLMITLLRYVGIPACFCSGRVIDPLTNETGMHDWLAFYVHPFGWIKSDPSYGADAYKNGDLERWHFYFENCDLYRMEANQAFEKPFENQEIWRKDPYDNQCGEAGFDERPQRLSYQTTTSVLNIKQYAYERDAYKDLENIK